MGISKQYSLPFLARVESGYCQVAEEEEVSVCRKVEDHQEYEIPIVQRIRSVLLKTSRIDDLQNYGEEGSFNAP